jgi:hypothetical protein
MTADPFDAVVITPTVASPGIGPIVIGLGVALVTGPKKSLCDGFSYRKRSEESHAGAGRVALFCKFSTRARLQGASGSAVEEV